MFPLVDGQLSLADERSRADATFMGPFPGVTGHFVPSPVADAAVPFEATLGPAFEGFFSGVRAFVLVEGFPRFGLVRTVAAAEGGLGMAVPEVALEVFAAGELFATFDALVLFGGVALHVGV